MYRKFIQGNVYQILSESSGFCRRYDNNILVCFYRFTVYIENLIRALCAKFYQNRLGFVEDMTKHFGVFFGFTV